MRWRLINLVAAMAFIAPLVVANGTTHADTAIVPPSVESLSRCIRQSQELAAVILMDKSKSLRDTDKFGRRALLGAALVDALSAATGFEIEGRNNQVDVLLTGFGTSLSNHTGAALRQDEWRTLGPETLPGIDGDLAGLGQMATDEDTDYVDALSGAMEALARHAAEMNAERPQSVCRLILWFTDGKFDISTSSQRRWWAQDIPLDSRTNTSRAVQRGRELLCAPQGVANEFVGSRSTSSRWASPGRSSNRRTSNC